MVLLVSFGAVLHSMVQRMISSGPISTRWMMDKIASVSVLSAERIFSKDERSTASGSMDISTWFFSRLMSCSSLAFWASNSVILFFTAVDINPSRRVSTALFSFAVTSRSSAIRAFSREAAPPWMVWACSRRICSKRSTLVGLPNIARVYCTAICSRRSMRTGLELQLCSRFCPEQL